MTLNTRMTQEDWDKLTDVEMESMGTITFRTPSGKEVKYIPLSVLQGIRDEISAYGSIWVAYCIPKARTDRAIEGLVEGILRQAKEAVLNIIDRKIEEMVKGEE